MTIGKRIKELRVKAGWSQATLAEEAGFKNGSTIGNYEQGLNAVSIKIAESISEALKPVIGDHYFYLITGKQPEEYVKQQLEMNEKGYLHISQVSQVITNVLVNASSLGLIKMPKQENKRLSIINSIVENFKAQVSKT